MRGRRRGLELVNTAEAPLSELKQPAREIEETTRHRPAGCRGAEVVLPFIRHLPIPPGGELRVYCILDPSTKEPDSSFPSSSFWLPRAQCKFYKLINLKIVIGLIFCVLLQLFLILFLCSPMRGPGSVLLSLFFRQRNEKSGRPNDSFWVTRGRV